MKILGQKGFSHLLLILAVLIIVVIVAFVATQGFKKILPVSAPSQKPAFNIKTEYQNPFKQTREESYTNPFENLK